MNPARASNEPMMTTAVSHESDGITALNSVLTAEPTPTTTPSSGNSSHATPSSERRYVPSVSTRPTNGDRRANFTGKAATIRSTKELLGRRRISFLTFAATEWCFTVTSEISPEPRSSLSPLSELSPSFSRRRPATAIPAKANSPTMSPSKPTTALGSDCGSNGAPPGPCKPAPPPLPDDEFDVGFFSLSVGATGAFSASITRSPIEVLLNVPSGKLPLSVNVCSPNSIPSGVVKVSLNAPFVSVIAVPSFTGVELTHTSISDSLAKPSP